MRPIDPRLLRISRPTRRWIALAAALSAAGTLATIGAGLLVGAITAAVIAGPAPGAPAPRTLLAALVAVGAARGLVAWARRRLGRRAAAAAVVDLRARALARLAEADPRTVDRARWRTLLLDGIEGLGPYLTGFLPALAATAIATPAALAVLWWLDPASAVIAGITLPLIPLFMWLVGTLTQGRTERRLRDVGVLADQMLDLVAGLPTLRAHRRTATPAAEIRRLSGAHRQSTMAVLRVAFLSGFVLEFLATLSVALVAVGIGFRLLDGSITLAAGLTVLVIVPEAYQPVREVGARFHDAQDGLTATGEVLALLDGDAGAAGAAAGPRPAAAPPARGIRVEFDRLTARGRDGARPRDLSGVAEPGAVTVLAGPNGSGKSTALLALLGIAVDGVTGLARAVAAEGELRGAALWARTSYLPQRPALTPALVGDASGLSLGQRQRAAVAAELARGRELLLLDEPTAHLDQGNAARMLARLRAAADRGATVLIASHDPLVLAAADRVVEVGR
ncbi:ABC transporter transmembrane domain-containing protein [Corynebacterium sphenisci]|uniref:ABC transporter transmembrane domain-containing protein n=1 Tax=Corynebacterium sphenisci TaxID=191493 RepID=UPI0026E0BA7D|nr:ABC transporter transmembrane domain-containing protein [Corynebacterium sphenisci]MDO5732087.1 ABC transporter transmembrane domain-containing protein [Corynebacterium sphenisci]